MPKKPRHEKVAEKILSKKTPLTLTLGLVVSLVVVVGTAVLMYADFKYALRDLQEEMSHLREDVKIATDDRFMGRDFKMWLRLFREANRGHTDPINIPEWNH